MAIFFLPNWHLAIQILSIWQILANFVQFLPFFTHYFYLNLNIFFAIFLPNWQKLYWQIMYVAKKMRMKKVLKKLEKNRKIKNIKHILNIFKLLKIKILI